MIAFGFEVAPVTKVHSTMNTLAFEGSQIRGERECLVIGRRSILVALELDEDIRPAESRLCDAWIQSQRLVVSHERIVVAIQAGDGIAEAQPRLGQSRL